MLIVAALFVSTCHPWNALGGIVVELAALGCLRDARHGRDVDHISRLGIFANLLRRAEEREERKRGEIVRSAVYAVRLEPYVS